VQRLHETLAERDAPQRITLSIGLVEWHPSAAQATAPQAPQTPQTPLPDKSGTTAQPDGRSTPRSDGDMLAVDGDDPAQDPALQALLSRADEALYAVKRAGRNGTRLG
jgi:hypothetical protein